MRVDFFWLETGNDEEDEDANMRAVSQPFFLSQPLP